MTPPTPDSGFAYGIDGVARGVDAKFAGAYDRMSAGSEVLTPKVRELIGLAINAAPTHLNRHAVVDHVRAAREHGASDDEILEALQIAACLGIHSLTFGGAILAEESEQLRATMASDLSPREKELVEHWVEGSGRPWLPVFDPVLRGAPEVFGAWCDLMIIPVQRGTIEPKIRELIYLALDAGITHMHPGTRAHIRLALEYGASCEEIMAALSLSSLVAVQGYGWGVHALLDESP